MGLNVKFVDFEKASYRINMIFFQQLRGNNLVLGTTLGLVKELGRTTLVVKENKNEEENVQMGTSINAVRLIQK